MARIPRIWCIEGEWSPRRTDRRTVLPLLQTIESCAGVKHIHNPVSSRDSLELALGRWGQKQYAAYSVGYLSLHGAPGELHIGRTAMDLGELGSVLDGSAKDRILYFAACSTLDLPKADLDAFRKATGARALVGYQTDVDWIESAAFDLLLLEAITSFERPGEMERWMRREHAGFCERLGFTMNYRGQRAAPAKA